MNENALYDNRVLAQRDKDTIEKKNLRAPEICSAYSIKRGSATYYFTTPERMQYWLEKHPDRETPNENILLCGEMTGD